MKEVSVEVIGVEPPCPRCNAAKRIVERAVSTLGVDSKNVKVSKLDIASGEAVQKYGLLMSPALAVNGVVKIMGRVPTLEEVKELLRSAAKG